MDAETPTEELDFRLPSNVRKALFNWTRGVQKIEEEYNARIKKNGFRVGIGGTVFGVIGFLWGVVANSQPPEIRYMVLDNYAGRVLVALPAKDAPSAYGDGIKKSCLSEYVKLRESYLWQTDSQTHHSVAIRSSAAEQKRYDKEREDTDLGARYGTDGYSTISRFFPAHGFIQRASGIDKTEEWDVTFVKAEILAHETMPRERKATARINVRWLPDAPMSDVDRNDNRCGTYVLTYNVTEDQ